MTTPAAKQNLTASPRPALTPHKTVGQTRPRVGNRTLAAAVDPSLDGERLPDAQRAALEAAFGQDLGHVRIHNRARAELAARYGGSPAVTIGPDVYLGDHLELGEPHSDHVLAHEVAHVVQQTGTGAPVGDGPTAEADAELAARAISRGEMARVTLSRPIAAHRAPPEPDSPRGSTSREELLKRLAQVKTQLESGIGVRTPEASEKLEAEKLQLESDLGVMKPPTPPASPSIDWSGGNLRGLGAEGAVQKASYPNATQLPKGFPGVDFIEGGTRTPLTGTGKVKGGKLNFTADSAIVEGVTAVQLKTLKNSEPSYQKPDGIEKTLNKALDGLANLKPGTGKSEQVGNECRRIEIGSIAKKILHVELELPPTPDQQAQINQVKAAGKSFASFGPGEEIEVVVNWPKIAVAPDAAGAATRPKVATPTPPGATAGKPTLLAPEVDTKKAAQSQKGSSRVGPEIRSAIKSAAIALLLDYLTGLIKQEIAESDIARQSESELTRLKPAIETMLASNPKQIHAVFHVHIWVTTHDHVSDQGVSEKSGFPMVDLTAELADHGIKPVNSTRTEDHGNWSITFTDADYSVLLIDVEKEIAKERVARDEQKLKERQLQLAEEAKKRGMTPTPTPDRTPTGPLTNAFIPAAPTPPTPLLPGAPPPSVDQEAQAKYAKRYGASLLAEGVTMRNNNAPDSDRQLLMKRIQVWRGQMRKLIRDSSNYKATAILDWALHEFDDRMRSLGSELGIDQWNDE